MNDYRPPFLITHTQRPTDDELTATAQHHAPLYAAEYDYHIDNDPPTEQFAPLDDGYDYRETIAPYYKPRRAVSPVMWLLGTLGVGLIAAAFIVYGFRPAPSVLPSHLNPATPEAIAPTTTAATTPPPAAVAAPAPEQPVPTTHIALPPAQVAKTTAPPIATAEQATPAPTYSGPSMSEACSYMPTACKKGGN